MLPIPLELGTEQGVQDMLLGRDDGSVGKWIVVAAIKVVGHFRFELNTGPQVESKTTLEARVVEAGIGAVQRK